MFIAKPGPGNFIRGNVFKKAALNGVNAFRMQFVGVAFPDMSDAIAFEVYVEDGVPGTIVCVYNDDMAVATPFNLNAITVLVNGSRVTVQGFGLSPVDPSNVEITFTPPVKAKDVISFQYDCRVDPGFTDDNQNLPVNYALNSVHNQIS